jgi:hypothetical protein
MDPETFYLKFELLAVSEAGGAIITLLQYLDALAFCG